MKYEKKVSILGASDSSLPVMVQRPLRTSSVRINEDYSLSDTVSSIGPDGHTKMYRLFVQPFADVFSSFKFMAMQFSNSLKLIWKIFTVFDPGEFEDEVDLYNERRQAINKSWEPLKKRIEEQLGRTDPIFKMSVLGPEVFLANKVFKTGIATGKPVIEILTATGWDQLENNFKTDFDPNENLTRNSARIQKNQKKLLKKLNRLFFTTTSNYSEFYESVDSDDNMLTEAEKLEDQMSDEEKVEKFMKVSGLQDELDKVKIERSENILEIIPKLKKILLPLNFSSEVLAAKNFEEFSEAIKKIQSAGGKVSVPIEKIRAEIEKGAQELMANEEFRKNAKVPGSEKDPASAATAGSKALLEKARLAVFTRTKEDLNVNIVEQLTQAIQTIRKSLINLELDDQTLSAMDKDEFEVVKRASKVYKDFADSYKKIVENFNSSVGS